MPAFPPWIAPADPATHMAQGMHIGVQLGAQMMERQMRAQQQAQRAQEFQQEMDQAAAQQRFKETQAARQTQLDAQQQALAEQRFSLAASEAARKHQAFQEYQSAVAGGMDPNEAMLRWGPAMSANTGAAAAIRAHEKAMAQPKTWQEITMPSGLKTLQSSLGDIRFPRAEHAASIARVPEGAKFVQETEDTPAHWQIPAKSASISPTALMLERDKTERTLDKLMTDNSQYDLSESARPDPSWKSKLKLQQWTSLKARADQLRKRLADLESGGEGSPDGTQQLAPAPAPAPAAPAGTNSAAIKITGIRPAGTQAAAPMANAPGPYETMAAQGGPFSGMMTAL